MQKTRIPVARYGEISRKGSTEISVKISRLFLQTWVHSSLQFSYRWLDRTGNQQTKPVKNDN